MRVGSGTMWVARGCNAGGQRHYAGGVRRVPKLPEELVPPLIHIEPCLTRKNLW